MEDSDQPAKSAENQQTDQGMPDYLIYNLLISASALDPNVQSCLHFVLWIRSFLVSTLYYLIFFFFSL